MREVALTSRARIATLAFAVLFISTDTQAYDVNNYRYRQLCGKYELADFKSDGSVVTISCHNTYDEAKQALTENGSTVAIMENINGQVRIIDANLALLDLTVAPGLTYFYNNMDLTGSSYTYMDTGSSYGGVDALLVDTKYSSYRQQWVAKVKIGGYTGWIAQENFEIVPLSWIKSHSSYTVTNEDIRHNYVAKIQEYYYGSNGTNILCMKCSKGNYIRNEYICCSCGIGAISTEDNEFTFDIVVKAK